MTLGSLFDGIGGFPLAAVRNGITPVWASEIEPFPIEVTKHHSPEMIHVGDITKLNGAELPPVDIIFGGSPCQDLSVAGQRAGLAGARSGLFMEQIRIVKEMRNAEERKYGTSQSLHPRFFGWENVPGQRHREHRPERTSESYSKKLSELSAVPFMSLDLTPGNGDLLGEYSWEIISPSRFGCSTLNTGVSPREGSACFLSQILMEKVPRKYYLSRKACRGILRRARERGKPLPPLLKAALEAQAGICEMKKELISARTAAFAANQRDEVRDLHDVSAALCASPGIRQQTLIAVSDSPDAPDNEDRPAKVYCLNDQSGQRMDCSLEQSGTLLAQTSHAPVVYENHGIDSRYTGPHPVVPTMSARWGTGGNNTPLVAQAETICIAGNIIDREPKNGGNGLGCQSELAYTLTATDKHAVFCRKRVDVFQRGEIASTQSARQHKDATDLVMQEGPACLLIRRLLPSECELLQGYPLGWTDLPGASDSARYKALGNSVAIPCVEYLLRGIALVLRASQ